MKQGSLTTIILVLFGVLFVVVNSAFIVPESHTALVFRFGEPKNEYSDPGLRFKFPFAENSAFIDKRNRSLEQEQTEIIARNQERLIVDAFARYRITDPLLFFQSVRTEQNGEARLAPQFDRSIRAVLGEVPVDEIISEKRSALMGQIKELMSQSARPLGVEIIDVKILRADLPQTNSEAVFERMIAERNQLAQQYRSEGSERANQIRAQADRQVIEITSKAEEEAQRIRGDADGERNAVFAAAYGKDPEFFAFYRSLLAYEEALQKGETTILLSPDSEFLRYLNNLDGRR